MVMVVIMIVMTTMTRGYYFDGDNDVDDNDDVK